MAIQSFINRYLPALQPPQWDYTYTERQKKLDLGTKIKATDTFEQRNIGNCYYLAALEAILKSPLRAFLLKKIELEKRSLIPDDPHSKETAKTFYQYTFLNGDTVEIDKARVGQPENTLNPVLGPKHIQALELAMAERWRKERNDERLIENDQSKPAYPNDGRGHALQLMVGGYGKNSAPATRGRGNYSLPECR